ncbi:MAG TPA: hypothetical protein PK760_02000 [Flavobacteriales bacterium]|nr:hypothetical protein [Flavobacteriales bacterium]
MKRMLLNMVLSLVVLSATAQNPPNEYLFIRYNEVYRNVEVYRADRDVERISMNKENRHELDLDLKYVLVLIEKLETEGWVLMGSDSFADGQNSGGVSTMQMLGYFWTMRRPKP